MSWRDEDIETPGKGDIEVCDKGHRIRHQTNNGCKELQFRKFPPALCYHPVASVRCLVPRPRSWSISLHGACELDRTLLQKSIDALFVVFAAKHFVDQSTVQKMLTFSASSVAVHQVFH